MLNEFVRELPRSISDSDKGSWLPGRCWNVVATLLKKRSRSSAFVKVILTCPVRERWIQATWVFGIPMEMTLSNMNLESTELLASVKLPEQGRLGTTFSRNNLCWLFTDNSPSDCSGSAPSKAIIFDVRWFG